MKICFKCKKPKELSAFYKHPRMADGHLNKCIVCAKEDVAARVERKRKDPEWLEAEMERQRQKQARARANGTAIVLTGEKRAAVNKKYRINNPEKRRAHDAVTNALRCKKIQRKPCEVCASIDSEAHHEDYSKPLDVVWLCPKHHAERHRQMRKARRLAG